MKLSVRTYVFTLSFSLLALSQGCDSARTVPEPLGDKVIPPADFVIVGELSTESDNARTIRFLSREDWRAALAQDESIARVFSLEGHGDTVKTAVVVEKSAMRGPGGPASIDKQASAEFVVVMESPYADRCADYRPSSDPRYRGEYICDIIGYEFGGGVVRDRIRVVVRRPMGQ